MQAKWLSRAIFQSPVFYTIATSKKIMEFELKRLKIDLCFDHVSPNADATTHQLINNEGKEINIVCVYSYRSMSPLVLQALICHEAVHIWQNIRDRIGEKCPSHEFEAYAVQNIFHELLTEFERQTKPKRQKKRRKGKRI